MRYDWSTIYVVRPFVAAPTRCYNCQRYGHQARSCLAKARCSLCTEQHHTQVCIDKRTNNQPIEIKCANCGGQHTAANKSCPKFREIMNMKMENASMRRSNNRDVLPFSTNYMGVYPILKSETLIKTTKPVSDNKEIKISYASSVKGKTQSSQQPAINPESTEESTEESTKQHIEKNIGLPKKPATSEISLSHMGKTESIPKAP